MRKDSQKATMALSSNRFSSTGCCELMVEIFYKYVISLLKESSFSFSLDLKSGNDSISFSKFWRMLFQMEVPLKEILNLLLLSAVLGIL